MVMSLDIRPLTARYQKLPSLKGSWFGFPRPIILEIPAVRFREFHFFVPKKNPQFLLGLKGVKGFQVPNMCLDSRTLQKARVPLKVAQN